MFKLESLADIDSAEVEIKDPTTGKGVGSFVTLAGPEHSIRKQRQLQRTRKLRQVFEKTGKFKLEDPEDREDENTQDLASSILGWRKVSLDGVTELPFSPVNVHKLLSDPKRAWLRRQLMEAMEDQVVFIQKSETELPAGPAPTGS